MAEAPEESTQQGQQDQCEEIDFLFCAVAPDSHEEQVSTGGANVIDGAQAAVVARAKLWTDRDVLKVYFIHQDVAAKWKLTTDKIIEWANEWNKNRSDKIPEFHETTSREKADIRVELSEKKGCWSKVGTNAKDVKESEPTMVLNLGPKSGCQAEKCKRSLVIHEFGHALGLEHEHQRSDFWNVVKDHLDLKRMKDDKRVTTKASGAGQASYGMDWFDKQFCTVGENAVDSSEYDAESIMHYPFDKHWIKDKQYHDYRTLITAKLPEKLKDCLIGIHTRHGHLADDPSDKDFEALEKAYGAP